METLNKKGMRGKRGEGTQRQEKVKSKEGGAFGRGESNVCECVSRGKKDGGMANKNDPQRLGYRPTRAPEFGEKWAQRRNPMKREKKEKERKKKSRKGRWMDGWMDWWHCMKENGYLGPIPWNDQPTIDRRDIGWLLPDCRESSIQGTFVLRLGNHPCNHLHTCICICI